MSAELALEHIRVIDLTQYITGPYCTKLLADLGADVIKVERPAEGDGARSLGPFLDDVPGKERSGLFWYLNTNKRSVVLDLKSLEGQQKLRQLASQSHVLVENFSPGTMDSLGLTYESLSRDNPSLVMTSISNFGRTGPYRDYKTTDAVAYALSGLMYNTGEYDREPLKHGLHQALFRSGQYAAVAILAGIFAAQSSGKGHHIDVSIMETLITGHLFQLEQYTYGGNILRRSRKSGLAFTQPIATSDGYVQAGLGVNPTSWQTFVEWIGEPALADPKFSTPAGRDEHGQELDDVIQRSLKTRRRYELVREAQEKRLLFTVVQSPKDLVECLQLQERGYFVEVDQPDIERVKIPGAPFKMTGTPHSIRRRAPKLGEHNEEVNQEILAVGPLEMLQVSRQFLGTTEGLPLTGVRVLVPATAYSVPNPCKLLAWLGAEVIKIESLVRPSINREIALGPLPGSAPGRQYWNEAGSHNEKNLGDQNITLDFRTEEGRQTFKELVSISDVVMENWTPRVMKGFELGYEHLVKVKPDLIMVSVSAFGHTGPYSDYAAFGTGMEATTGTAWMTGYVGGPPQRSGQAYADDLSGIHALVATLVALQCRNRTGKGQWVDVSMYEAGHFAVEALLDYVLNGREGERLGNRDRNIVPQGCYACLGDDQWVVLSICNHEQWSSLCHLIGKSGLATAPRFKTKEQRWKRHDEIDRHIQDWTRNMDKFEAMHELQLAGIPAAAVLTNKDILLNRHLRERDYFAKITHKNPHVGQKMYAGLPFMFNGARLPTIHPTAEFGEHNWSVLTQLLGKESELVRTWENKDLIGTVPLAARNAAFRKVIPPQAQWERGIIQGHDPDYAAILDNGELVG